MGSKVMRLLGVNKGWTCTAKMLRNGGAAAYLDGHIIAIPEERVIGRKYAPGYSRALRTLLRTQGLSVGDFDTIGVSTCCEPQHFALRGHELEGHPRLQTINHHMSHAALAFYASGFDHALVVVIDGGGNILAGDAGQPSYEDWCYRPRYLNIQQLNYLWTIRHSSARIAGHLVT